MHEHRAFQASRRDADEIEEDWWSNTCCCKAAQSAVGLVSLIEGSVFSDQCEGVADGVCDVVGLAHCGLQVIASALRTFSHVEECLGCFQSAVLYLPLPLCLKEGLTHWRSIFSIPCVKQADVWRFPFQKRVASPEKSRSMFSSFSPCRAFFFWVERLKRGPLGCPSSFMST